MSQSGGGATLDNLIAQMSRGASVLSGWDAVLNIDEEMVNEIFQAQFKQSAQEDWKNITIAFVQTFPNPNGKGKLAVYTGVSIALETPFLKFLGDNQSFVEVSFKATGRTGSAFKVVPDSFDPKKDANPDDPDLEWSYDSFSKTDFTGKVPLAAVAGSPQASGEVTEFVIDFPTGSFISPVFDQVKDPDELRLQLKNYLQTHDKYKTETQYHTDRWGHRKSEQVTVFVGTYVKEMLQQTQAATVTVTPGQGLTPTLLTMVEAWAKTALQKDVEQAVNTALDLIMNPTNDFSMNSVASFTHTLSTSNVVPWYFTVDGTLSAFDAETWKAVNSEVNQQQLEVTFQVQEDLAAIGVERINLKFRYGKNQTPETKTFAPDNDTNTWFLKLPGQFDDNGSKFIANYEYQYDVIYAAPEGGGEAPPPLSTDWITDDATSVKFGLVQLGLLGVTFEAANIAWAAEGAKDSNGVKQITVDWNWIPGGNGPVLSESVVLNSAKASVKSTLRSTGPTNNQVYQYSLTFLMSDGTKLRANGLTGTSAIRRIDHPLSDVSVGVWPDYPLASAVLLRATFDDELNDIHLQNQWRVRATKGGGLDTDSFTNWDFKAVVANLNSTTIIFSGTWIDQDGKQHPIPKTLVLGTGNTLVINDTQKTVTAEIDASNVSFVPPKKTGVYRVVALVASTVPGAAPASGATPAATNPLAQATTLTFNQDKAPIGYFPALVGIDETPTFYYQYTYTVNVDDGKEAKETDFWAEPQHTVSTALPVIQGEPPTAPLVTMAARAARGMATAVPEMSRRTRALLSKHDRFCEECGPVDIESLLKN